MSTAMKLVIGNHDRGDDAAGLAVAGRIRAAALPGVGVILLDGDQLALLDAWADADDVYVIGVCPGVLGQPAGNRVRLRRVPPAAGPVRAPRRGRVRRS